MVPTLDSKALASTVLHILHDTKHAARLRAGARAFAEKHLDINDYLARYRAYIEEITGKPLVPPVADPAPKAAVKPAVKPAAAKKPVAAVKPVKAKAKPAKAAPAKKPVQARKAVPVKKAKTGNKTGKK